MKMIKMAEINYQEIWDRDGLIILRNAVAPTAGEAMLNYVVRLIRDHVPDNPDVLTVEAPDGSPVYANRGYIIIPEKKPNLYAENSEDHRSLPAAR